MAVRKIIRMGHPVLRQVARPLTPEEIRSPALRVLLDDMVDTLRDYGGSREPDRKRQQDEPPATKKDSTDFFRSERFSW